MIGGVKLGNLNTSLDGGKRFPFLSGDYWESVHRDVIGTLCSCTHIEDGVHTSGFVGML